MLIVDDHRRCVVGNPAIRSLLGLAAGEEAWMMLDQLTPESGRPLIEEQWNSFLDAGSAEGWFELSLPDETSVAVEFSGTANVLPNRHLAAFFLPDGELAEQTVDPGPGSWSPAPVRPEEHRRLTQREREVLELVAAGLQTAELGERLFLSPNTVKSHVQNVMAKLGAHTRAHAVAIALVTGQID